MTLRLVLQVSNINAICPGSMTMFPAALAIALLVAAAAHPGAGRGPGELEIHDPGPILPRWP
jgi:hypothetical protein